MKAAARSRIERLQSALDALGDTESTEVRGLQAALKEAERSAKERPFAIQVEECQAFIKRSQNRIVRLEEQRVREQQDAAMGCMAKLQEEMANSIPVVPTVPGPTQQVKIPDFVSDVERLRSRVAEMEMERDEARKKRSRSLSVPSPDLVGSPDLALQALHGQHTGQHRGAIMETLISRGSTLAQSSNWSPLHGVQVEFELAKPKTQVMTIRWSQHNWMAVHIPQQSGAAGLTVRQESDTESVASVNRDNESTVPAPVDQRVGSRRMRRLVLVGANPPPNTLQRKLISQLQIHHLNQEIRLLWWPRRLFITRFHRILAEILS